MSSDAQKMFETLCAMLDNIKWKYLRDDKNMIVYTSAKGNELTIPLHILISKKRNLMYTKSPMPFLVPKEKMLKMSMATSIANFSMLNGCFELDPESGYIGFRIIVPFGDCQISESICHYMVMLTCEMVDKFNDKFQKILNDEITIDELKAFVKEPILPQA